MLSTSHKCATAPDCTPLPDVPPQIAIAPTVMLLDFILHSRTQSWRIIMSVFVVCSGVTAATVTDNVAISNVVGLVVGLASVLVTAMYQIWAGSKQKELQATSSQLLLAYTPQVGCAGRAERSRAP